MHAADEGSALFERLLHAAALVEARLEEAVMPSGLSLAKSGVLARAALTSFLGSIQGR